MMKKFLNIGFFIFGILLISTCENGINFLEEVKSSVIGPIGEFQLRQDALEVVNGSTLTFLDTPTNGTRTLFFTIRNTGTGDVVLPGTNEVEIDPTGVFSATMPDSVISPGSSVVFSLTFDPPGTSTYSAEVTIETDIAVLSSFSFTIEGKGTAVDNTAPTGLLSIESGASRINSLIVDLTMTSDDGAGSGVTEMKISNDAGFSGDWTPYSSSFTNWSMSPGADGGRIVYAKFRDASGNESGTISDSITYETDPPGVNTTDPLSSETGILRYSDLTIEFDEPMDASTFTNSTFRLYRGATLQNGAVTSVNPYKYKFNPNSWLATNTSGITYTARVYSNVKDLAGNSLGSNYSWTFTVRPDDSYEGSYNNNYWDDSYNLWTTAYNDNGIDDPYGPLGSQTYSDYGMLWDEDWYKIYVSSSDAWPLVTARYRAGSTGANLTMQILEVDEDDNIYVITDGNGVPATDSHLNEASIWWDPAPGFPGGYYYIRIYSSSGYSGREYDLSWDDCDDCGY